MNKKISNKLKKIITTIMIILVLAAVLFIFTSCGTSTAAETETTAETTNSKTQQIIEVTAQGGGYSPRKIEAKAGVPAILVMKSDGAYGCERAFYIPDLNIGEILPENGQTKFDLGTQPKGTKLVGVCGMGMYYFQIFFN